MGVYEYTPASSRLSVCLPSHGCRQSSTQTTREITTTPTTTPAVPSSTASISNMSSTPGAMATGSGTAGGEQTGGTLPVVRGVEYRCGDCGAINVIKVSEMNKFALLFWPRTFLVFLLCVWIYQTALIQPCSCCQYFGRLLFFCLFVGSNREVIRSDAVNVVSGSCTRSERSGSFSSRLGKGGKGGRQYRNKTESCALALHEAIVFHRWVSFVALVGFPPSEQLRHTQIYTRFICLYKVLGYYY